MNNYILRTALSSVLIYVSFTKLFDILTTLLLWVTIELRIENEALLITIYGALGLFSVWVLIGLANKILVKEILDNITLYILIGLASILTIFIAVINILYGEYLAHTDLSGFNNTHLIQYGWSKTIDTLVPIISLLYFLWKLKKNTFSTQE